MKKISLFLIALISIVLSGFTVFEFRLDNIVGKFNSYYLKNHTQKVYIHSNKDDFSVGETIWFSAYVVDAKNKPDTLSENLYVELISPESEIIYVRLLKLENGLAHGDFTVADSLQNGIYQIRAFTEWMRNYDSDFFFTKEILVNNPQNTKISENLYIKARKIKRKTDNISVNFFPEGGDFVYGIESKVAFKALNYNGECVEINGSIKNSKNKIIAEFKTEHNGMGTFYFKPEENQKYKAEIFYGKNKISQSFCDEVLKFGYVISVKQTDTDFLSVSVNANLFDNNDTYYKTIYFIAQQHDKIKFRTSEVLENFKTEIKLPIDSLSTGIVQFTIFNGKGEPSCERLFFINKTDFPEFDILSEKNDNKINLKYSISDNSADLEKYFLSVSVIDTSVIISSENIISAFLLNSDLQGNIENPNYYFTGTWNSTKSQQLDLVMLTNGWRRFDWNKVLSDETDSLEYNFGNGITVEGRISKVFLDLPSKETKVNLTVLDSYNDVFSVLTDDEGHFCFEGLYAEDSLNILVEAITKKDKDNVLVNVNEYDTVPVNFVPYSEGFIQLFDKKSVFKEKKEIKAETNSGLHGTADQVIYCDDLSSTNTNVLEVIKSKVPGVDVYNDGVNIRNNKSLNGSNEPLYLIDDMPSDINAVKMLNVGDVERIEIIKSTAKTAIYGSRASNGVIAIYTKKGFNIITGWQTLKLIAYYTPREYYQPIFEPFDDTIEFNSIFWKPDICSDNKNQSELNFNIPQNSSAFRVIFQGISESGNLIYFNKIIEFQ